MVCKYCELLHINPKLCDHIPQVKDITRFWRQTHIYSTIYFQKRNYIQYCVNSINGKMYVIQFRVLIIIVTSFAYKLLWVQVT